MKKDIKQLTYEQIDSVLDKFIAEKLKAKKEKLNGRTVQESNEK